MVAKKHNSKRVTLARKYSIKRKAREHRRKTRKLIRKGLLPNKQKKKIDKGIPVAFREQVLQELEEERSVKKERKEIKVVEAKERVKRLIEVVCVDVRNPMPSIVYLTKNEWKSRVIVWLIECDKVPVEVIEKWYSYFSREYKQVIVDEFRMREAKNSSIIRIHKLRVNRIDTLHNNANNREVVVELMEEKLVNTECDVHVLDEMLVSGRLDKRQVGELLTELDVLDVMTTLNVSEYSSVEELLLELGMMNENVFVGNMLSGIKIKWYRRCDEIRIDSTTDKKLDYDIRRGLEQKGLVRLEDCLGFE